MKVKELIEQLQELDQEANVKFVVSGTVTTTHDVITDITYDRYCGYDVTSCEEDLDVDIDETLDDCYIEEFVDCVTITVELD